MFRIEFSTDNAGTRDKDDNIDPYAITAALRDIAVRITNGEMYGQVRDINGNLVGAYDIEGTYSTLTAHEPPDNTCAGYSNYETFTIGSMIDNNESDQAHWLEAAKNAASEGDLADELQEAFEEMAPAFEGVYSTLLNAALHEVDWHELARDLINSNKDILTNSIKVGSTSSDSCKLEDIVAGIEDLITEDMLDEFELWDDSEDDAVGRTDAFDEIVDYLNEIAPEGVSFSAHPGDPACWGFWKDEVE